MKNSKINKVIILLIAIIPFLLTPTVYADNDIVNIEEYEKEIISNEEDTTKKTIVIMGAGISLVTFFCTAIFGEKD